MKKFQFSQKNANTTQHKNKNYNPVTEEEESEREFMSFSERSWHKSCTHEIFGIVNKLMSSQIGNPLPTILHTHSSSHH
jgi:hypothetical protein